MVPCPSLYLSLDLSFLLPEPHAAPSPSYFRALPEEGRREEEPDLLQSECSPEQTALIGSTQACRVLVDPQGPFAACHQIIAPEPFKQ